MTRSGFKYSDIAYASIENPKLQGEQILGVIRARGRMVSGKHSITSPNMYPKHKFR